MKLPENTKLRLDRHRDRFGRTTTAVSLIKTAPDGSQSLKTIGSIVQLPSGSVHEYMSDRWTKTHTEHVVEYHPTRNHAIQSLISQSN